MEILGGISKVGSGGTSQNFPVQEMMNAALQSIQRQDTVPATASSSGSRL